MVARIVYGNEGMSTAVLDVITNATAADVTQVSGGTYEIPLAEISVGSAVVTIEGTAVTDRRYTYRIPSDKAETFGGATITPGNDREYRNATPQDAMEIILPAEPSETYITGIRFEASAAFTGITIKQGGTTISGTSGLLLKGDSLGLKSRVYNLVIWWDGSKYWCASAAA